MALEVLHATRVVNKPNRSEKSVSRDAWNEEHLIRGASNTYLGFDSEGDGVEKTVAELKAELSFNKNDIGLGNVDNTSDVNKPVSTLVQAALGLKTSISSLAASAGASLVGFLQAGIGAVARTLQAKLRDTVSVWDFDVAGDGTTEDTSKIQAAIDSLSEDGGTLDFGNKGTFLTGQLNMVSGVNLRGRGAVLKLKNGANSRIISGVGVSNVIIDGLILDGNKANQTLVDNVTDTTKDTIHFINSGASQIENVVIKNCTIFDSANYGITFGGAKFCSAVDNRISGMQWHGIATVHGSSSQLTEFCVFSGNKITGICSVSGGVDIRGGAGIIIMGSARRCTVSHNVIDDVGPNGDGITGYNNAVGQANIGHSVTGNVITRSGNHGIHMGGDYTSITGNTIYDYSTVSVGASGILIQSQAADPTSSTITVAGNTVYGSITNCGPGIYLPTRSARCAVSGNSIYNSAGYGIRVDTSTQHTITGNVIRESLLDALLLNACTRVVVTGNLISDSVSNGINITGASQLVISGNMVYNSGTGGTGYALQTNSTAARVSVHGNQFRDTPHSSVVNINASSVEIVFGGNYMADATVVEGIVNVASAAAVTLPAHVDHINITGTTNITSIVASWEGRVVTLSFADVLTLVKGGNLKINSNFVTSADDTITLRCDGSWWVELSRSAN